MAGLTEDAIEMATAQLEGYDSQKTLLVRENEEVVDQYEDRLGTYLLQLAKKELQLRDSHTLSVLLHSIGDLERISDHAVNIAMAAGEIYEKKLSFSETAIWELKVLFRAVQKIVHLTMEAVRHENLQIAQEVEPLEEVIDEIADEMKHRHIRRLREGRCSMELGFILLDLLTSCKRIADHCSNISVCLIQADHDEFGRHSYLHTLKEENDQYREMLDRFAKQFTLPVR
jgi:phosphate:Na+ symporter